MLERKINGWLQIELYARLLPKIFKSSPGQNPSRTVNLGTSATTPGIVIVLMFEKIGSGD